MDFVAHRLRLKTELVGALYDGHWTAGALAERGAACLDRWPRWMDALALRAVTVHKSPPGYGELLALVGVFLADLSDDQLPVIARDLALPAVAHDLATPGTAHVALPRVPRLEHSWPIAPIATVDDLAERLELSAGQLAWLADVRGLERTVTAEKLRNYRYRLIPRRGGVPRVVEAPKARLKEVQRWILRAVLDPVPVHPAVHGFRSGRSVLTHAALHTGSHVVVRIDLKDFFASVSAGRVRGIFRTLGYPRPIARVLAGLTTNVLPASVWHAIPRASEPRLIQAHFALGRQLAIPHLPQGGPCSPALANLAAFRLDRRVNGFAQAAGFRYSRYADDLTFSAHRVAPREIAALRERVTELVELEGFRVNAEKTTVRTAASRQSVCGIVVNAHPNVTRTEYDQLKAILHNCAVHGQEGQNRDGMPDFRAHLLGRIAWVASLNPARGEKLRQWFAAITWE